MGNSLDGFAGAQPERLAVAFATVLRRSGVRVPLAATVTFGEALAAVGLGRREPVYWAGRATLLSRPEDTAAYDLAFEAFWLDRRRLRPGFPAGTVPVQVPRDGDDERPSGGGDDGDGRAERVPVISYSHRETLRTRDFADCTAAELAEARRLMAAVRLGGAQRASRRRRRGRRRDRWPDLRRSLRHALADDGELVLRERLARSTRPRRTVLLCDVSGSMEPYARELLRFLHVAVAGRGQVEAFTIGTRLTRITRELGQHDPDAALAQAAAAVRDWSGGTRLGDELAEFLADWGVPGMARGAVVVILSDGWDRGDPEVLARQMRRLAFLAHRVVWVNPLKATPGYAPLARGMAAALPYVDEFLEGHSVAALEQLATVIAG
ncbi:MAG TPA: VWA domain-containing protein [Streptosporangiaceae bacterium]